MPDESAPLPSEADGNVYEIRDPDPKPSAPTSARDNGGDGYPISAPPVSKREAVLDRNAEKLMERAATRRTTEAEQPPERPKWPLVTGVFEFPWYMTTGGHWALISFGGVLTLSILVFFLSMAVNAMGGYLVLRGIAVPAAIGMLTTAYASAVFLSVIEGTAAGWDSVDIDVGLEWREWMWSFAYMVALLFESGLVGFVLGLPFSLSADALPSAPALAGLLYFVRWLVLFAVTLCVFPVFLLSAMSVESAWYPAGIGRVLPTMAKHWKMWGLFYFLTAALTGVSMMIISVSLVISDLYLFPLVAPPVGAAAWLIFGRLIGRLALVIGDDILISEEADKEKANKRSRRRRAST